MGQNTAERLADVMSEKDETAQLKQAYEATQMMLCELNKQYSALREENDKLKAKLEDSRTLVDAQQARINELDEQNLQLRSYFGPSGAIIEDPAAEIARLQHLVTANEAMFQDVVSSPSFRIGKTLTSAVSPLRKLLRK